jgi:hypothetical protein
MLCCITIDVQSHHIASVARTCLVHAHLETIGLALNHVYFLNADAGPGGQHYATTPTSNATRLSLCKPFA